MSNFPGRVVISNCAAPTEKASEFLDYQLRPVTEEPKSYMNDSEDLINKIKNVEKIPECAILVMYQRYIPAFPMRQD